MAAKSSLAGRIALSLAVAASLSGGCDNDDAAQTRPARIQIGAQDYTFEAPQRVEGGLVEITFVNHGREPHFLGIARVGPGRSFADVKAALLAPPSQPAPGPPPFEDFGGVPTTDSGATTKITLNLAPGTYALFCLIPSADGVAHAVKGMITELTVTAGTAKPLPTPAAIVTASDFAFDKAPTLKAGTSVVRLRNQGGQTHEINLVELSPGKTVDDVVTWYRRPTGPPPMRSLGGVAVPAGGEADTTLSLRRGSTYAFICAIPDMRGDFSPHVSKGMFTGAFTVS